MNTLIQDYLVYHFSYYKLDNLTNTIMHFILLKQKKEEFFALDTLPEDAYRTQYVSWDNIARLGMPNLKNKILVVSDTPKEKTSEDILEKYGLLDLGFEELNTAECPVNKYLSSGGVKVRAFKSKEYRSAIVFTTSGNISGNWERRFFSTFPFLLSWEFEEGKFLEGTLDFFRSLTDEENMEATINRFIEEEFSKYDTRKIKINKLLGNFEQSYKETRASRLRNECANLHSNIRDFEERIRDFYRRIKECSHQLIILDAENIKGSLVDFFYNHREVEVLSTSSDVIDFYIESTIEYYDIDTYKATNSLARYVGDQEWLIEVFNAIFLENKGSILTGCCFSLVDFDDLRVQSQRQSSGRQMQARGVLPHPHLYGYSCWGGNGNEISKFLSKGDWDMAIEQAIAAVKNLNFGDSTVMNYFLNNVRNYYDTREMIIADNGKRMTFKEFYEYIKKENENNV